MLCVVCACSKRPRHALRVRSMLCNTGDISLAEAYSTGSGNALWGLGILCEVGACSVRQVHSLRGWGMLCRARTSSAMLVHALWG